jgi:hypothetical protein
MCLHEQGQPALQTRILPELLAERGRDGIAEAGREAGRVDIADRLPHEALPIRI